MEGKNCAIDEGDVDIGGSNMNVGGVGTNVDVENVERVLLGKLFSF